MEVTRLFDYAYNQLASFPMEKSLARKEAATGVWKYWSTAEIISSAEKLASGLLNLGLTKGDKIAIVSYKNRPEWVIADLAIQMAGMIGIPLYPTISAREYSFILNDAGVKVAFCGGQDLYDKLTTAQATAQTLSKIFTFDVQPNRPHWESIFSDNNKAEVEHIKASIDTDDLATIIYTSGTTGNPKGVMLSHRNIVHVVNESANILPGVAGESALSFLPLCHIFERAATYVYFKKCISVHYTGTDTLSGPTGDLANVRPVVFTTVPRLLEKVYEAIYNKGLALTGLKKKLFFWAMSLTDDYKMDQKGGLSWKIADKLIFSKWREALGGKIKGIITGAAPCPVSVMRVFNAAGIPVREGYGLTETSPTMTANTLQPLGAMLGTVGAAIDQVEIFIDESDGDYRPGEGEILTCGPSITRGYYNNPEANEKSFKTIDGKRWFCTGDIGRFVQGPNGKPFLKITDRKKELLKTSGGKYVAPAPIENRMKEDFLIEQMMVVGDNQKFTAALIVPSEPALRNWCSENNIAFDSLESVLKRHEVIARYQEVIDHYNPEFSHIEQVKKFTLLPVQWLPFHENGADAELTPTMKLKRRIIMEKFSAEIQAMYR